MQRAYDASNRLTTLMDGSNNTMATYSYDNLDRATGIALANGTSVAYGYDLLNRLSYVNNTLSSSDRNYSYVYDNASRVTSTTEPRGTIASGYTDRNEVNSISEPTGSPFADEAFNYDAGFNRSSWILGTSKPAGGDGSGITSTSYAVNNLNQYSTVSGKTAPTWNPDGGLKVFDGNTYIYDALQRLTEVDYSGGKTVFGYDPLGRRISKIDYSNSGVVTIPMTTYHYDGSEVAVEYEPNYAWTYYLGAGIDRVVLRYESVGNYIKADAKGVRPNMAAPPGPPAFLKYCQFYYQDGQGSVSAVADPSGKILEEYEYNAQGQFHITNASSTVEPTTQIDNDILYTGREYDYETGNYFYRARYYNPELGRFISRDPLSGAEFSQGTNLYAYCRNNFLNASDPTGMCLTSNTLTAGGNYNYGNDPDFSSGNPYDESLLPGGPNINIPDPDPTAPMQPSTIADATPIDPQKGNQNSGSQPGMSFPDALVAAGNQELSDASTMDKVGLGVSAIGVATENPAAEVVGLGIGINSLVPEAIGNAGVAAGTAMGGQPH